MAEETNIALTITIGGEEKTLKTLKEIKAARKDLQNAFLQGDQDAVKSIKKLDDAMGDLQDATKSVTGDGLEPLRNSFNLFKDGITNLDFGKIGTAFKGLGAAMKAVPIFLLVEGITYLISNFKELSEGTGLLAKVLKPIGDLLTWLYNGFTDLLKITSDHTRALDEMGEAVKTNADKARESLALQTSEYDRQIAVAKAAGKSTVEIEQAKQQAIIDTNVQVVKQIEAFVRAGGVLDEEKQKLLTASLEAIKNAKVQEYVIEENHQNELNKLYKEKQDERRRLKAIEFEKTLEDNEAEYQAQLEQINGIEAAKDAAKDAEVEREAAKNAELLDLSLWKYETEKAQREKEDKEKAESAEKEKAHRREVLNNSVELTSQSIKATQAISDMYFSQQLKNAKGNAEKEREIKKKQFNINKAFGITNAVIDGVRGVQAALAQGPPLGYVFAALTAVMAAVNVAQIANAKFDDSGSGGGSSGASPVMGSVGGASAPTIASPNNTVTQIDDKGEIKKAKEEQPVVKAIVTEEDITDKQKRVNTIKEAAEL